MVRRIVISSRLYNKGSAQLNYVEGTLNHVNKNWLPVQLEIYYLFQFVHNFGGRFQPHAKLRRTTTQVLMQNKFSKLHENYCHLKRVLSLCGSNLQSVTRTMRSLDEVSASGMFVWQILSFTWPQVHRRG